jgi:tetratricopeptide (TPR) repeat protein
MAASAPPLRVGGARRAFLDAAALHAQGRLAEAERRYLIVLGEEPKHFEALYRLGLIRLQQARFGEAAKGFRRALAVDATSANAMHHLAVALSGQGRHEDAIARYGRALELDPSLAEACNNWGHSLQQLGRSADAVARYEQALDLRPDYPEALNNLGVALQALGRVDEAKTRYEQALASRPNYPDAMKNLAGVLAAIGRLEDAAALFGKALSSRPGDALAHVALGDILRELDRPEPALAHYQAALSSDKTLAEAHDGAGAALHMLGRSVEAEARHRAALALALRRVESWTRLGAVLQSLGRLDDARAAFERAAALSPGGAGLHRPLANLKPRYTPDDPHLRKMIALVADAAGLSAEAEIDLRFALGKALGDVGDAEGAFQHIARANALHRSRIAYDEEATLGRLRRIAATFTAGMMAERAGIGEPSELPVFVVGLPRSGTTLIEQILASHPAVHGAGEPRHLANLAERIGGSGETFPEAALRLAAKEWRAIGSAYAAASRRLDESAARVVDKMPGNFALIGLIRIALPNARVIHVRRDPRDTAVSLFATHFARGHEFAYELGELGRYIRSYLDLMAHWRAAAPGALLEVDYEALVGDLEGQTRRMLAYCGLPWDEACLAFPNADRSVRTASAVQVRRPIHARSIGRWRVHADRLRPLLEAMGDWGPS